MNTPSRSKKHLLRRKRNAMYMRDPGPAGPPVGSLVRIEDIDMDAIDRTVAFSDWYEAVLGTSPLAKRRG